MKRMVARWMPALFLMFAASTFQIGCSSSEEAASEEEVAADGNENAADPNEQSAENEGNEGSEGNEGNEGGNNVGLNQEAEGNNAGDEATAANGGGEEDLQQIIEEMNGANTQLANQGGAQAFDNVGGGNAAPLEQAPVENLTANVGTDGAAAPAPAATGTASVGMPAGPGLPELGSKMVYIVQKGDTLAKIAQRVYGDGSKWTEIANFTGLANPKLIYPGDVVYYQLTEQSMTFAGAYEGIKRNEVQVGQGDTLATIAGRVLGNSTLWKLIWRQNDKIDNPDRLTAGTTLYYVDPAQVASFEAPAQEKVAQKAQPAAEKAQSKTVTPKVQKSVVFEVANDHMDDLFNRAAQQTMMQRSMI